MRKRKPPLESAVTQMSPRSSKSPYDCFDTRKPLALVASMTPSATRQSAFPVTFQLLRSLPLNNFVHPPLCAAAAGTSLRPASPATTSATRNAVVRMNAPFGCKDPNHTHVLGFAVQLS